MNLALVTWSYDEHQGISRCVAELGGRLGRDHEVHVYAAEVAAEPRPGVRLHRVPLRHRRAHWCDWDFYLRAGRALRHAGHDLVHTHLPIAYPADVHTCHGLARMAMRSWRSFPPHARRDVPTLRLLLPGYSQVALHARALRRPHTRIAAVSRKVQREVAEESGRPLEQIALVPNAVDLERFAPRSRAGAARAQRRSELGIGTDRFALLWAGHELRRKGFRHALGALEQLPERTVLLVAGGDDPERWSELAPRVRALRSAGRLRFLGLDSAMERTYAAADALLFPSLYESFGLVVLEAMAAGLPAVTARSVAFAAEAISDGQNGFVLDHPWDVDGMVTRLRALLGSAELRARIARAGRRTAEAYSWDAHTRRTLELYEAALGHRSRARLARSA